MTQTDEPAPLQTKRLNLRPLSPRDAKAFLEIFSDAKTMQYWSMEPIKTLKEAKALLQADIDWPKKEKCFAWGIALPASDTLIGKVTLFHFSEQNQRAELGYILNRKHWGTGYMTEVVERVLDFAFNELMLHRIEVDTDPQNLASLALMDKTGFVREGIFRHRWYVDGRWCDSVMLGQLASDYKNRMNKEPGAK